MPERGERLSRFGFKSELLHCCCGNRWVKITAEICNCYERNGDLPTPVIRVLKQLSRVPGPRRAALLIPGLRTPQLSGNAVSQHGGSAGLDLPTADTAAWNETRPQSRPWLSTRTARCRDGAWAHEGDTGMCMGSSRDPGHSQSLPATRVCTALTAAHLALLSPQQTAAALTWLEWRCDTL